MIVQTPPATYYEDCFELHLQRSVLVTTYLSAGVSVVGLSSDFSSEEGRSCPRTPGIPPSDRHSTLARSLGVKAERHFHLGRPGHNTWCTRRAIARQTHQPHQEGVLRNDSIATSSRRFHQCGYSATWTSPQDWSGGMGSPGQLRPTGGDDTGAILGPTAHL